MDTDKQGWVDKYLSGRMEMFQQVQKHFEELNTEQAFYSLLQPTGLIYGYPSKELTDGLEILKDSTLKDRLRLLLCEGFINSAIFSEKYAELKDVETGDATELDKFKEVFDDVGKYLTAVMDFKNEGSFFQKSIPEKYIADHLIAKLTEQDDDWTKPWAKVLNNSLMFIEIIMFYSWLTYENKKDENIRHQRDKVVLSALKIMALAAQADNIIQKEEKKLFNHFVSSSNLDDKKQEEAMLFIDNEASIDNIDFSIFDFWLLRKYILELAILVTYADRKVNDSEHNFLKILSEKLQLSSDELESSLIAIDGFVVNNWSEVGYLDGSSEIGIVTKRLQGRMQKILISNKNKLVKEVEESKELMQLLRKSASTKLTKEEKAKVKAQLLDILKTIPALAIFLLPLGTLIFPLLLKIIPKNLLVPSSFVD